MAGDGFDVTPAERPGQRCDRALVGDVVEGGLHQGQKEGEGLFGRDACSREESLRMVFERDQVVARDGRRGVVEDTLVVRKEEGARAQGLCQGEAEGSGGRVLLCIRWCYGYRRPREAGRAGKGLDERLQGMED